MLDVIRGGAVQEASFQLVTRVMNFVDYKLDKLSLINFDQSLISDTLQTELCVNQRARYLEAVPVCKVSKGLFPDCFAMICAVLKKMVCENGEASTLVVRSRPWSQHLTFDSPFICLPLVLCWVVEF